MLTSKHLITALEKADWLDRILILSAFMFFVLVVLFIFKQRFIDRGLRIALWWTKFIPLPDFSGRHQDTSKVAEEANVLLSATTAAATSLSSAVVTSSSSLTITPSSIAVVSGTSTSGLSPHDTSLSISAPAIETNVPEPSSPVTGPVHVEL